MWHDPENRLQKAIDRYEEGDLAAARAMLRALERQGVVSAKIDVYLGHCHMEDDRPEAALRRYRRAAALKQDEAAAWIGIALCHGRLGQVERALSVLEHAARLAPDREEIHCHLAHCHALLGSITGAQAHAARAMELDPDCPHVRRHLAIAYLVAGRPQDALDAWKQVLDLDPRHPEADVGRGRCYAVLGRRTEARRHYARALGGEYAAEAHAGLGDLAYGESRFEDAVVHYGNALAADPDHDEARRRLAESLLELGRVEDAWTTLRPRAEAWEPPPSPSHILAPPDPSAADLVALAARVLAARGRRAEALRLLRRYVGRHREASFAWSRLGRHLLDMGRARAAVRPLRRAMRLESGDPLDDETGFAARYLARALGRLGRLEDAVSVVARAVHRTPGRVELHLDLVAALLARGRLVSAERALRRAIDVLPGASEIWAAAAELSLDRGHRVEARHRLRGALRLDPRNGTALALLARWHLDRGDALRAYHAARAGARVLPVDHGISKDEARALLFLGRPEEAAVVLRRYVLSQAADPQGYRLLARALEESGDPRGARTQRRLGQFVGAETLAPVTA